MTLFCGVFASDAGGIQIIQVFDWSYTGFGLKGTHFACATQADWSAHDGRS